MTEAPATGTKTCLKPMNRKVILILWSLVRGPYPYPKIMLQGFRTLSQTLSAAYGAASAEIQIIVWKSLAKTTAEDWTFVWGASGAICQWVDSVRPAMASSEESTKDQAQLLAEARQAGKDVLDSILKFIPEEEEPTFWLRL